MQTLPDAMIDALERMHLLDGARPVGEPLTGGVSSDIWRVELPTGSICIKRALPKLRVTANWMAPVERNLYEARWMRAARRAVPAAVPELLGQDSTTGMLAMAYLPPDHYPVWKSQLAAGLVDVAFAALVAETLGRIHAATAVDPSLARQFPTDEIFYDIRLEPYLVQVGRAYPALAARMKTLIETTQRNKRALVHGDVSPKNILCGPQGPVFLDAECAWWGDPAFDLAFCLNHLLLKCLLVPAVRNRLLASFDAMTVTYLRRVDWEPADALEARAAQLLPALLLARVDGKSPVEYITEDGQRSQVRSVALKLLAEPSNRLADVVRDWTKGITA